MKKSSLQSLVSFIDSMDAQGSATQEVKDIRNEMVAELAKGKAKADANREVYAEIHDKVIEVLSGVTAPVTAQDIANETGIARGKIVYGLTKYWGDEVVADKSGKTTTYRLA